MVWGPGTLTPSPPGPAQQRPTAIFGIILASIRDMKRSQKLELLFRPSPEISRLWAAKATAHLTDEQAVNRAGEIQKILTPFMAQLQERYLHCAKTEHEASAERRLIVDHGEELIAALESAIKGSPVLGEDMLDLLRQTLCASELLIYPCCQFTETLTAREIVARGSELFNYIAKHYDAETGIKIPIRFIDDMRNLSRDDIDALRMGTDEYLVQQKIFDLLRKYLDRLVELLKEIGAKDASLMALGLIQLFEKRRKRWFECLTEQDAADFVEGLKSILALHLRDTSKAEAKG